jgi:hypothetical protein
LNPQTESAIHFFEEGLAHIRQRFKTLVKGENSFHVPVDDEDRCLKTKRRFLSVCNISRLSLLNGSQRAHVGSAQKIGGPIVACAIRSNNEEPRTSFQNGLAFLLNGRLDRTLNKCKV